MNKSNLKTIISDSIAIISISRSPVNALSTAFLKDIKKEFEVLEENNNIRIIILKSDLKNFSAGADLKQRSIMDSKESINALNTFRECFKTIENSSKITICCINGYCLGGGAEMALCFDFRLCADDVIVGFPEVGIGIIPGAGGTQRLPRVIGYSNAKYWIYTAARFNGIECLQYGFANEVHKTRELCEKAIILANTIIQNSPIGTICAKKAIDTGFYYNTEEGLDIERVQYNIAVNTEDRKEALDAFAKKRKPKWRNK